MKETREKRMSEEEREILSTIEKELGDSNTNKEDVMRKLGEFYDRLDAYDPIEHEILDMDIDFEAYKKIWEEASKMREDGTLVNHLKNVKCPIYAIHGDYDGHPYVGVKEPLEKYTKESTFILLKNCGHHPWFEREGKEEFYNHLNLLMANK